MSTQTQPILLRRTPTPGVVPAASEFTLNTFVINNADGILYYLDTAGNVQGIPVKPGLSSAEQTIASAATTDLASKVSYAVSITGTTTITSFGTGKNQRIYTRITGVLTLTHNATSLILPGAANITTQAGDTFLATSDASGNWTVRAYQRADGTAIAGGSGGTAADVVRTGVAQSFTAAARKQGKRNLGVRGAFFNPISAATTLDATYINSVNYVTAAVTVTMPSSANYLNGDSFDFVNTSTGTVTLTKASGDTNGNFYYGKGVNATSITIMPGAGVSLISDGLNLVVLDYGPSVFNALLFDQAQTLTTGQQTQLFANMGFRPVQQGGGPSQVASNNVQIGYDGTYLRAAVNGTDMGAISFAAGGGMSVTNLANGTDLNTTLAVGFYDGTALTNTPAGYTGRLYVEVQPSASGNTNTRQMAFTADVAQQSVWVRNRVSGTWGAWRPVIVNGWTLTASATAPDFSKTNRFQYALSTANITIPNPANMVLGSEVFFLITAANATWAVTWGTQYIDGNDGTSQFAPTLNVPYPTICHGIVATSTVILMEKVAAVINNITNNYSGSSGGG